MKREPARLIDGDSCFELAEAARAASRDILSEDAVMRVRGRLLAQGIGVAGAVAGVAAGTKPALTLAGKLVAMPTAWKLGIVAVVALGGGLAASEMAHKRVSTPPAPAVLLPPVPVPAAASVPAPLASSSSLALSPEPLQGASPSASARIVPTSTALVPSARRSVGVAPSAAPSASSGPAPTEGALLLEARRILDSDPARALALVRACEEQFPNSQLAPERARIAAEAQKRLGP
jgi:hypothetical protein